MPVIQLIISNTFLVRLMQQLFLSKHLIIKFYILCVISVKCTVWILKWLLNPMTILIIVLWTVVPFLLQVIQLMISNTFLVRLMQQLFLSKHLIIKFYILCVISVKCTVWILKLLLNPMIILIIVSESTIECSSIILFVMVGRYTFLKFEKNNINSIF